MLSSTDNPLGLSPKTRQTYYRNHTGYQVEPGELVCLDFLRTKAKHWSPGRPGGIWETVVAPTKVLSARHATWLIVAESSGPGARVKCTLWGTGIKIRLSEKAEGETLIWAPVDPLEEKDESALWVATIKPMRNGVRVLGMSQGGGENPLCTFDGWEARWGFAAPEEVAEKPKPVKVEEKPQEKEPEEKKAPEGDTFTTPAPREHEPAAATAPS